jgi:hypothetical protein
MTNAELPPPNRSMPSERMLASRRQLESISEGRTRTWRWRLSRGTVAGIGVTVALAGGASAAVYLPTKGAIPPSVNGVIDLKNVPDFLSVESGGKVVGYASKGDILPISGRAPIPAGPIPVYGADLKRLVGHLYPGIGYVALGQSPALVACRPEWTVQGTTSGQRTVQLTPCPSVTVTLPNVVGMRTPTGAAELSGLGVSLNVVNVPTGPSPRGTIVAMMPIAGTRISARSTVTIENATGTG